MIPINLKYSLYLVLIYTFFIKNINTFVFKTNILIRMSKKRKLYEDVYLILQGKYLLKILIIHQFVEINS